MTDFSPAAIETAIADLAGREAQRGCKPATGPDARGVRLPSPAPFHRADEEAFLALQVLSRRKAEAAAQKAGAEIGSRGWLIAFGRHDALREAMEEIEARLNSREET